MSRRGSGLRRFAPRAAVAVALAAALDLGLARLHGYAFRTDVTALAVLDVAILAAIVVPLLAALHLLNWVGLGTVAGRLPAFAVAAAAWAPVALVRLWHDHGAGGLLVQVVAATLLAAIAVVEIRRPRWLAGGTPAVAVLAAASAIVVLATRPPVPGRSLLHAPPAERGALASPAEPNLLLIVLDTLRADHLGLYGYPRPTSPWLDGFAQTASVFDAAVSSSTYTLPAHATLFTGLYPRGHGADIVEGEAGVSLVDLGRLDDRVPVRPLASEAVTLAELARRAGLDTGAICANSAYLYRFFGLDQGFATYVDTPGIDLAGRPFGLAIGRRLLGRSWWFRRLLEGNERFYLLAPEVNRLALDWLDRRRDRRFFLFLNYMDPHRPYLPVGEYRRLFPAADRKQEVDSATIQDRLRPILPDERDPLVDAYDAEIRYLDDHLAILFARLGSWGLLDRTLVVIVGDHGESFGEHHRLGHAVSVYQSEARIPLLVRRPGQRSGERVERFVHLVDVLPTVLELAGIPAPGPLPGVSLFTPGRARPLVVSLGRYQRYYNEAAIYRDPWKMIERSSCRCEPELFDLRRDPNETIDVVASQQDIASELRAALEQFQDDVRPLFKAPGAVTDEEALNRLRALGYVD